MGIGISLYTHGIKTKKGDKGIEARYDFHLNKDFLKESELDEKIVEIDNNVQEISNRRRLVNGLLCYSVLCGLILLFGLRWFLLLNFVFSVIF